MFQSKHKRAEYDKAEADLRAVLAVDGGNKEARRLLSQVINDRKKSLVKERNMYKNMLSYIGKPDSKVSQSCELSLRHTRVVGCVLTLQSFVLFSVGFCCCCCVLILQSFILLSVRFLLFCSLSFCSV